MGITVVVTAVVVGATVVVVTSGRGRVVGEAGMSSVGLVVVVVGITVGSASMVTGDVASTVGWVMVMPPDNWQLDNSRIALNPVRVIYRVMSLFFNSSSPLHSNRNARYINKSHYINTRKFCPIIYKNAQFQRANTPVPYPKLTKTNQMFS
jgi:hypothetical protein